MTWETWKQGFTAWEHATSQFAEQLLTNPTVLRPAGAMLTATMKAKAATNRVTRGLWSALGLPTREDQLRSLHKLNQLESRILDLEEQLAAKDA